MYPRMAAARHGAAGRTGVSRERLRIIATASRCVSPVTARDVQRGWGGRHGTVQSVNEDYLYDHPVMLGSQRIGPDLANIGLRETNETFLLQHLYDPQSVMPTTVMPPYRYLFEKRPLKFGAKPSEDALPVKDTPE